MLRTSIPWADKRCEEQALSVFGRSGATRQKGSRKEGLRTPQEGQICCVSKIPCCSVGVLLYDCLISNTHKCTT